MKEVKREARRARRCENMVRRRHEKKQEMQLLNQERECLEAELKRLLIQGAQRQQQEDETTIQGRQLALEAAALRNEFLQLSQTLDTATSFQTLVHESMRTLGVRQEYVAKHSVFEASERSQWVLLSRQSLPGWRVTFPNSEPSFFLSPLTREECDSIARRHRSVPLKLEETGRLFGWTVQQALSRNEDGSLLTYANFSTRARCPFDVIDGTVTKSPMNSWPLLATPEEWNQARDEVCTQVLQEFDERSRVMVTNVPGPVHTRYLHFVQDLPGTSDRNTRMMEFITVAVDSNSNALNRIAEQPQQSVQWVHEGGYHITFTEVDDETIDISYTQWGNYVNERHAQQGFVRCCQIVCQHLQLMTQTKLLE